MSAFDALNRFLQGSDYYPDAEHEQVIQQINRRCRPQSHWQNAMAQYRCQVRIYQNRNKLLLLFPLLCLLVMAVMAFLGMKAVGSLFRKAPVKSSGTALLLPNAALQPDALEGQSDFLGKGGLPAFYTVSDYRYCLRLSFRFALHPYFLLKTLYAIYQHSGVQKAYQRVVVSNEYSFFSSVLTDYFHQNGVEVANCMHGEKLLNARDAFCVYDRFYVWDDHYSTLLQQRMHCRGEFIVSHCPALRIDYYPGQGRLISYFLQGGESADKLQQILSRLETLCTQLNGDGIRLKPHPKYLTLTLGEKVWEEMIYSGQNEWLLGQSLAVCGRYTTLLFQVYVSRKAGHLPAIYIDDEGWDVPEEYIMLQKANGRFSELSA